MTKKRKSALQGKDPYSKYLFLLFFFVVLALAFMIARPFLSTIVIAAVLAYVLRPVYNWFVKKTKMPKMSAVIMMFLLFMIVAFPFIIIAGKMSSESYSTYLKAKQAVIKVQGWGESCEGQDGLMCSLIGYSDSFAEKYNVDLGTYIEQGVNGLASSVILRSSRVIFEIPKFFLHLFIALFIIYYMFIDGKDMLAALKNALPLRKSHRENIFKEFSDVIYATIYGAIVMAILQGVLATIGYFIFGVSSPLILGLLTLVAAFIPFVGAALIWLPTGLVMLINGLLTNNTSLTLKAAGLMLYGFLVVSSIDNLLKPKIISAKANLHPLVVIIGVFGGLAFFGAAGIIIGPLLLALFVASLKIYQEEKEYFE